METKGYYRQKRGTGFSYVDTENKLVKSKEIREFIESLHIPPAWEDVWIAAESNKILATGYDSAGRKQYIYDPDWQRDQSVIKYKKLNKQNTQQQNNKHTKTSKHTPAHTTNNYTKQIIIQ